MILIKFQRFISKRSEFLCLGKCAHIMIWRMLMSALRALVKKLKEVTLYKKCCNYYIEYGNNLYFQDKISLYGILNQCP